MKKTLFWLLPLFVLFACKKNDQPTPPPTETGEVTPKGTVTGTATSLQIGPSGGSIQTADNHLKVDVPAGAVAAATTFSIQPITNETPNGLGVAYRLSPEGTHFDKPVTITFTYDNDLMNGANDSLVYAAYQGADGIWLAQENTVVDKTNHTISVQSSHFSDWSIFSLVKITADKRELNTEENAHLKLEQIKKLSFNTNHEATIGRIAVFTTFKWDFLGNGNLLSSGYTATFIAPSQVPPVDPTVVIWMTNLATREGVHNIAIFYDFKIKGQEFVEFTLNNKTYHFNNVKILYGSTGDNTGGIDPTAAQGFYIFGSESAISDNLIMASGSVLSSKGFVLCLHNISTAGGTYPFEGHNLNSTAPYTNITVNPIGAGNNNWWSAQTYTYNAGNSNYDPTQGSISLSPYTYSYGSYLEGSFSGTLANITSNQWPYLQYQVAPVTGSFRARF